MIKKISFGLILAVCLTTNSFAQEGTLLVANRVGGSISMIDLATQVEIARLPVAPVIPHEVHVSPDGRWALTTEYGPNSGPGRFVILIDVVNAQVVGKLDLGPDSRPHTALFLPDSRHAVATMQDSDQLALIDTATLKVVRTYPTGAREGHMVRVSPDGDRAYVTSRGNEGHLSVIYLEEDRAPTVIETGAGAEGIAVSPDGSEIWVANRAQSDISVIDAQSLEVVDVIETRPFSGRVEIGDSGLVAAVNGGGGTVLPQYARIYDQNTREFLREAPTREGQLGAGNFGALALGDQLYVSDPVERTIKVFDMNNMDEPKVLAYGLAGPDGMDWSPLRVGVMDQ